MKSLLSVRVSEDLLVDMKTNARRLQLTQTEYIRRAIEQMNKTTEKRIRKKRLEDASRRVRQDSMTVNREFSEVEYDPED